MEIEACAGIYGVVWQHKDNTAGQVWGVVLRGNGGGSTDKDAAPVRVKRERSEPVGPAARTGSAIETPEAAEPRRPTTNPTTN